MCLGSPVPSFSDSVEALTELRIGVTFKAIVYYNARIPI